MYQCFDCGNLDKLKQKKYETGCYNYGCNANGMEFTIGCVSKDSELKLQGCGEWIKKQAIKQMSMFEGLNL